MTLYHPRHERLKKVDFEGQNAGPSFSPFVDESSRNLVHMHRSDRSLQRHFPIDDILLGLLFENIGNKVAKSRS